jgi:acetyltransferase-like isoleucine patch superfamily enzyme
MIPYIKTLDVKIGKGVRFGRNVRFYCKSIRIGDGCVFQDNVRIDATHFEVGDYATFYPGVFIPGPGHLRIGHNLWMGKDAILDAQGDTQVGNNVGIGAGAQLWSHSSFGSLLEGHRFQRSGGLLVEDHVWIAPGVQVAPVRLAERSMLLMGAVVTHATEANRVYAGVPAVDVTGKLGPPFQAISFSERRQLLESRIRNFELQTGRSLRDKTRILDESESWDTVQNPNIIAFDLNAFTYQKTRSKLERKLMRFLLPDLKFVPR